MRRTFALLATLATPLAAQTTVSIDPAQWTATDTLRAETWQGKPSLWFRRGVALANGTDLRNGTLDVDIGFDSVSNNAGIAFHGRSREAYEVIFFRPGLSNSPDAVQYAPALHNLGTAWQLFWGDGNTNAAPLHRNVWMHVRIRIHGDSADLFLDNNSKPTLLVPHLAVGADGGALVGIWTGAFGSGVHVANMQYTRDDTPHPVAAAPMVAGTIMDWELSQVFNAESLTPGTLPPAASLTWQKVRAESPGFVLINRYVTAPALIPPVDHPDQVLAGKVAGSKVIYLRTIVNAATAGVRKMTFGFSDGVLIYSNGVPLFSTIRPSGFRNDGYDLGKIELQGDAVYLPLHAGRNEIVVAVTEFFGGWAFGAQML